MLAESTPDSQLEFLEALVEVDVQFACSGLETPVGYVV